MFSDRQLSNLLPKSALIQHFSNIQPEVEAFLIGILQAKKDSPIELALKLLLRSDGFERIHQLAQKAGLSPAQFRKRFREEVGMSPKEYSKILRVNAVARYIRLQSDPIHFTELTYRLGYYDQSHLIKDFQAIMGVSPSQYSKII